MKGRKHRETGGVNEAAKDITTKPGRRNADAESIFGAAEARKRGGRAKGMKAEGDKAMHHAGRMARKSGGSCESSPFSSARSGTAPKGRKLDMEMD
jgi:hypothetical protein